MSALSIRLTAGQNVNVLWGDESVEENIGTLTKALNAGLVLYDRNGRAWRLNPEQVVAISGENESEVAQ